VLPKEICLKEKLHWLESILEICKSIIVIHFILSSSVYLF
jgi:hypothetical protein